jgi:hypothetical protein
MPSTLTRTRIERMLSWYGIAVAFLVAKAITVLLEIRPICHIPHCGAAIYIVGKVTPSLICFAFYNDAVANRKNLQTFWLWMLAIVPAITMIDMAFLEGRL